MKKLRKGIQGLVSIFLEEEPMRVLDSTLVGIADSSSFYGKRIPKEDPGSYNVGLNKMTKLKWGPVVCESFLT